MYRFRALFILLLNIGFLNSIYSQNEFGIWANEKSELLRTKEFALLFERIENRIIAKFFHFHELEDNQYECRLYGEIQFQDTVLIVKRIKNLNDSLLTAKSIGVLEGDSLIKVSVEVGVQKLKLVERIRLTEPYDMKPAEEDSVGRCLQEWMLGTRLEMSEQEEKIRFSAGTNSHSYMLDIQENFIYCRSARIKSCNRGTLFAQNIRLYDDGQYKAAMMKDDNYREKTAPLEIDYELFNPKACIYDEVGFYWSLIRYDKNRIVLNGCSGEYNFRRLEKDSNTLNEWIKLENN